MPTTDPRVSIGICRSCKTEQKASLYLKPATNGAETFVWACNTCGTMAPFGGATFLSVEWVYCLLTVAQLRDLPVLMPQLTSRCARCGNRHAEQHHWAPKEIFKGEANDWPTDYLCKKCHDEWHQKMNAARKSVSNP